MTTGVLQEAGGTSATSANRRAGALAERLEQGARALEDHAVRHSYHHLARIRQTLAAHSSVHSGS